MRAWRLHTERNRVLFAGYRFLLKPPRSGYAVRYDSLLRSGTRSGNHWLYRRCHLFREVTVADRDNFGAGKI